MGEKFYPPQHTSPFLRELLRGMYNHYNELSQEKGRYDLWGKREPTQETCKRNSHTQDNAASMEATHPDS